MICRALLAVAVAIVLLSQHAHAQSGEGLKAPPSHCEIRQSAWCILYSDATYEDVPSESAGYSSYWTVRGGTWKEYPLLIKEPVGCRNGKSDTIEFISFEHLVKWRDQVLDKLVVKIKSDGSCNLEFLYPKSGVDPVDGAFFAAMTLVKACQDAPCSGDPIGRFVRSKIRR